MSRGRSLGWWFLWSAVTLGLLAGCVVLFQFLAGIFMLVFGPWVVPAVSPNLPRPEGVPASAQAAYDIKHGMEWLDCVDVTEGRVTARWWGEPGAFRDIVVRPGARCDEHSYGALSRSLEIRPKAMVWVVFDTDAARCEKAKQDGMSEFMAMVREARVNHSFGSAGNARADAFLGLPATPWTDAPSDGATSPAAVCQLVPGPPR